MSERERLEQYRDQVLADIVDLDKQVADGEIPEQAAQRLRADYETSAARALAGLEQLTDVPEQRRRPAAGTVARRMAYVCAAVVALVAVGVLLPRYLEPRPPGGTVSGNVAQSQSAPQASQRSAPPRDLSTVSNAQMEAVIARNPNVIGMRLALAERYMEQGSYDKAAEHYNTALKQQPKNPKVLAQAGRFLLVTGKPAAAKHYVQQALRIDPSSADALLLRAEILVRNGSDLGQARTMLRELTARPELDEDLRRRAEDLLDSLRQRSGSN